MVDCCNLLTAYWKTVVKHFIRSLCIMGEAHEKFCKINTILGDSSILHNCCYAATHGIIWYAMTVRVLPRSKHQSINQSFQNISVLLYCLNVKVVRNFLLLMKLPVYYSTAKTSFRFALMWVGKCICLLITCDNTFKLLHPSFIHTLALLTPTRKRHKQYKLFF